MSRRIASVDGIPPDPRTAIACASADALELLLRRIHMRQLDLGPIRAMITRSDGDGLGIALGDPWSVLTTLRPMASRRITSASVGSGSGHGTAWHALIHCSVRGWPIAPSVWRSGTWPNGRILTLDRVNGQCVRYGVQPIEK